MDRYSENRRAMWFSKSPEMVLQKIAPSENNLRLLALCVFFAELREQVPE